MEQKSKQRIAPPRYDESFKAGAIRLVTEQHRPAKEVAAELGICIECFYNAVRPHSGVGGFLAMLLKKALGSRCCLMNDIMRKSPFHFDF